MLSLHNQSYLEKSLFWLTILKGEPRMMGTKGSRWPEQEAERMSVGLSGEASSGKDPHPKGSLTPKKHHQLGTKSSNT